MARFIITIDGPAASGKSTVARLLARKLNATFLDTGAMYRAVTLAVMRAANHRAGLAPPKFSPHPCGVGHCEAFTLSEVEGVGRSNLFNQQQILDVLDNTQFTFTPAPDGMRVQINDADVTEQIRDPKVTANARYIAADPSARRRLVQMQRKFAQTHERIVTEGRDQGTVAFPDADVKFFLIASLDERAKRRQAELSAKGVKQCIEEIQRAIKKRDQSDENRSVGPLKPASDAVVVDTTDLTIEQVVEKLLACMKGKCPRKE